MQDRIGQQYKVEYSTDGGTTRHFLQHVDPFERVGGGMQQWVHIPGITNRVNLQIRSVKDSSGELLSAFETKARDGKWHLYATLVSAPSDGAASASTSMAEAAAADASGAMFT